MTSGLLVALAAVAIGVLTGATAPAVLRWLPEPELDAPPADGEEEAGSRLTIRPVYEKVLYADLARSRALIPVCAVLAAAAVVLLGTRLGWHGELAIWLVTVPVGTWLGYIDARTTFLPTRLIWPALGLAAVTVLVVGAISGDWHDVLRAAIGCLAYGGVFYALWWLLPGFGFGDVRLGFLLGLLLGYLGWYEFAIGFVVAQFLGGFGGGLLALLKLIDARRNPFGPYMLVAALIGAGFGPELAGLLGY